MRLFCLPSSSAVHAFTRLAATGAAAATILSVSHASVADGQIRPFPMPIPVPVSPRTGGVYGESDTTRRSGPRVGVVWLGRSLFDSIQVRFDKKHVSPLITLFGWQFEFQIGRNPGGPQPLTALIPAAGGLEEGLFIPSLSWIVGMRLPNNVEFGVGPNISPAGPALVLTAGVTTHMGTINVPFNLAVVPSSLGPRVSVTTGFNTNR